MVCYPTPEKTPYDLFLDHYILNHNFRANLFIHYFPPGIGEPDEVSSNDEGDGSSSPLNDSFTEGSSYSPRSSGGTRFEDQLPAEGSPRSSGGLHSPRSPGGTRLEDQLPAFVPPKRYVKPEEKKDTKAPGVMIMVGYPALD